MNIKNIKIYNQSVDKDFIRDILNGKTPTIENLMLINAKYKIMIGVIIEDTYDRTILITPFGYTPINENTNSEVLNKLDLGVAACGIYTNHPELILDHSISFDCLVYYEGVDAIVNGKNMIGLRIINETSPEFMVSVNTSDEDLFDSEVQKMDFTYIAPIEFNNSGKDTEGGYFK